MKRINVLMLMVVMVLMTLTNVYSQGKPSDNEPIKMKRFLVERTFPNKLVIPINMEGSEMCLSVVSTNLEENVTWVHSYVSKDKKKTYCIYDAPSPEAIKKSAEKNGLPVDNIIEVSVLDPYFYQ